VRKDTGRSAVRHCAGVKKTSDAIFDAATAKDQIDLKEDGHRSSAPAQTTMDAFIAYAKEK
jgi:hypothetical protein